MSSLKCKVCGEHTFRSEADSDDDRCNDCRQRDEIKADTSGPPEWTEGRLAAYAGILKILNPYNVPGNFPNDAEYLWNSGYDYQIKQG